MEIRKLVYTVEEVQAEAGVRLGRPIRRAAAIAVIANPYAGTAAEDLGPLFDVGLELGELVTKPLADLLGGPAVSYGKAAIVGTAGEMEHGGAILHPKLGKPMRAAIGGGQAIIPSNAKVAAPGALDRRAARPQGRRVVVRPLRHDDGHGAGRAAAGRDRGGRRARRRRPAAPARGERARGGVSARCAPFVVDTVRAERYKHYTVMGVSHAAERAWPPGGRRHAARARP